MLMPIFEGIKYEGKRIARLDTGARKVHHRDGGTSTVYSKRRVQFMGAASLAERIGQSTIQAKELLQLHRETYREFWKWSDAVVDYAMLHGRLWTAFGWTIHVGEDPNPRFLRNYLMRANGAEILRLACCFAVERGVCVCAPIHDAILIEAPLSELNDVVITAQEAMSDASSIVLNGFRLRSDAKLVLYPDRYVDERGQKMWDTVWSLINQN